MFDFHMHSRVSADSHEEPLAMALAARERGLQAICFTDHLDYDPRGILTGWAFDTAEYNAAYDDLSVPGLEICRGMEFGMLPDNQDTMASDLARRPFDFVIGSVHFIQQIDPYFPEFWENRTVAQAEEDALLEILTCVRAHDEFDVLGHLTYICKTRMNPEKRPVDYTRYREITDEIFKVLVQKGKGIEVNTGAVDICGVYLPEREYLQRFRELGGEIVTVGSDAHDAHRVGQYCREAAEMVRDIFGYVCTFRERKPVFHH